MNPIIRFKSMPLRRFEVMPATSVSEYGATTSLCGYDGKSVNCALFNEDCDKLKIRCIEMNIAFKELK